MTYLEALEEYGQIIKDKYQSPIATEHTLRTPFENLLNTAKPKEIKVVHEAIKEEYENGTPDFKIFKQIDSSEKLTYPNLVGYIECKKLNEDLCIGNITEDIWNYTIGGYQVIDKWLKYRVDYECSREELEHLVNICKIIKETVKLQNNIEEIW